MELLHSSWQMPHPIRMLTVTALNLAPADQWSQQLNLFSAVSSEQEHRAEQLEGAMDQIRAKFGAGAIAYGAAFAEQQLRKSQKKKNDGPVFPESNP